MDAPFPGADRLIGISMESAVRLVPVCLAATLLLAPGCRQPDAGPSGMITTATGLAYQDLVVGTGPAPAVGQVCVVEVLGWLEEGGTRGRLLLDSRKRGYPFTFPLGVGRVIKGWDEGLATMKVGGKRLLRVPPALGYTVAEAGADFPADATLLFELELVRVR